MSMKVDYTTPLTRVERSYLESRGLYADIQRADGLTGTETPEFNEGDGTGLQQVNLMTSEQRASERERLLARLAEIGGDDESAETSDDTDEVEPYEVWTVDDLKAEIDLRNEGRPAEAKLAKTGKQGDLAQRLYQDDENQARQQA